MPLTEVCSIGDAESASQNASLESQLLEMAIAGDHRTKLSNVTGAPEVLGFEMICRLGAGSSGEVWLADELELARAVTLKILHRHGTAGASAAIMQQEFRILAKLLHPNLVTLYFGIVTTDGRQGLAMEWIDGWPLDVWLQQNPDVTLEQKLNLFHEIVRGVTFLHDHGVIHRDLKPANVIVNTRGVAKIVDFGLARLHQADAEVGSDRGSIGGSGTLHFMAPEQAANGEGARAMPVDVYALGLILYRLLIGKWLYSPEGTPAETLAQVLHPPPLDFLGTGRGLPRDLQSILRRALAPDPAARYHHARDLEADLIRLAAKQPVAARKHTVVYLITTLLRRQARRSALAGVLVLVGLVAGGLLYQRQRTVAERNEANLRHAYTLTSYTLQQLRDDLRAAMPDDETAPLPGSEELPDATVQASPLLPLTAAGELDLRYYQAVLADLRSATSEGQARYVPALKSIQHALDLYSELALESPNDPKRLLDAAQARLSFARLLARAGRTNDAGDQAHKIQKQVDRLTTWPGFDPAPLASLRCDALQLLARQAHSIGDFAKAVKLSEEMLAACEKLPPGLLVRPENESMPRLALAAYDLATDAIAATPSDLPRIRLKVTQTTAICRAAYETNPTSFPLACGLARCLHAGLLITMHSGDDTDLSGIFQEAADLLIDPTASANRSTLSLIWEISVPATEWTGKMIHHPEIAVPEKALLAAQKLTTYLRRCDILRDDVLVQQARIHLYQSLLSCRAGDRATAARPICLALMLLRPRQVQNPDSLPLALVTATALHQARSLAEFPDTRWGEKQASHLDRLLTQLLEKADELTPAQQQELATLK